MIDCSVHQLKTAEDFADQLSDARKTNNTGSSCKIQVPVGTCKQLTQMKGSPAKLVGLPPIMTESEARQCINDIKQHWTSIRALVLELKERRGWEVLGYPHLTACLEAEF
ncbi:MAG: hypothetical protein JO235_02180, partial [Chroococcidiopsidaceae cyanobacterium CP_BM_RX_35]|nr:hypothetical protein [Chroococcidiopsidaceae cyanobacterium CP_BM_RX_35]